MPAQIFGAQANAVQLYQAFYGAAPSNPIYSNYVAVTTASSPQALALTIGNQFSTVTDTALATTVLTNLGITATTVAAASYTALQTALTAAFAAYPTQRGIVVLNLSNILTGLETDATFGSVAQTYNQSITAGYTYASNTANTQTQTTSTITTAAPLTVNAGDVVNGTSGNDTINGNLFFNAPSGTYIQTLQSGDSINGGAGTDTLNLGINVAGNYLPAAMTSIEIINATVTAGATTLDNLNGTGLNTINITNSTVDLNMLNLSSLLTNVGLSSTTGGVIVASTAATVAGTADTVAVALSQVTGAAVSLGLAGYEVVNVTSNGSVTNIITTFTDPNLRSLTVSGTAPVTFTGGSAITGTALTSINASAATGAVIVGAAASTLGTADQSIVGGSGNDTFFFGGNYTSSDTVNGGAGTDTLSLNEAAVAGVTSNQANLSNLEVVSLATASTASTYTPNVFGGATGLTYTTASAANSIINYQPGASALTFTSAQAITGTTTVNVSGVATTDSLNFTLGTATTAGTNHSGNLTFNGVETINLASNGTSGNTLGTVTMTPTAATEAIVVTGNASLQLGALTADSINASANTGGLVMVTGTVAAGGINITGSSAADTLFGGAGVDIINGGNGNDRIAGGAADAANQADVLTGGAGADTFVFAGTNIANFAATSAGTTAVTRITDFVAGVDKLALITGGPATSMALTTTQTIGSAANLTAVYAGITAIAKSVGNGALSGAVIVVSAGAAAGTYLYVNDNANAAVTAANDFLLNITGITGTLTAADIVFA